MNQRLEDLAYQKYPQEWVFIDDGRAGYEKDINYYKRQEWLEKAKEIYNLALEDVRKEVESMREGVIRLKIESDMNEGKLIAFHDIMYFIDQQSK